MARVPGSDRRRPVTAPVALGVADESARLTHVVMGTGAGFHRDQARVTIANSTEARTAAETGLPTAAAVTAQFQAFRQAMEQHGVTVHQPVLAPDSVQDQTCPRDIGFVIGDAFVTAGMRQPGRLEEIAGLARLLPNLAGRQLAVPDGMALEGGDVLLDRGHLFVGQGQRSDPDGLAWLQAEFGEQWQIVSMPTRWAEADADVLHLDCAFNPLGLGHALIYPPGLKTIPDAVRAHYDWIEVDQAEAEALATNVVSLAPDTIIARDHPSCARVNALLRHAGYQVIEVGFDAVPSIGGSFRCATLPLQRSAS